MHLNDDECLVEVFCLLQRVSSEKLLSLLLATARHSLPYVFESLLTDFAFLQMFTDLCRQTQRVSTKDKRFLKRLERHLQNKAASIPFRVGPLVALL